MAIEHIETFVEDSKKLALGAYRGKPRFEALLSSYIKETQKLEDAIWTVILGRMLENAEGVQLDAIGRIVGQPRRGEPDERYKALLIVRIAINRSEGHPDDIIRVIRLVSQLPFAPHSFEFDDLDGPAAFRVIFADPPTAADNDAWSFVFGFVEEARAGGVGFTILWPVIPTPSAFDASKVFRYGDATTPSSADVPWAYGDAVAGEADTGGHLLHTQSTSTQ